MRIIETTLKISDTMSRARSDNMPFRHTCCLFHKSKLMAVGINNMASTHGCMNYFGERFNIPKFKKFPMIHAEVDAIRQCWGKTVIDKSFSIVVVRHNNQSQLRNSKPCPGCSKIINGLGITNVFYSNKYGEIVRE